MSGQLYRAGDEPVFQQQRTGNVLGLSLVENPGDVRYRSLQHEYNCIYRDLLDSGVEHLLFDLSRCRQMDTVIVGMLVAFTHRVRSRDGNAVLVGVTPEVSDMIQRLMLLQPDFKRASWMSFPTQETALAALPW
jgi:hypothetical protein